MRLAPLLLLAACSYTYTIDLASSTMPRVHIKQVKVTSGATRITFRYDTDQTRRIGVHGPGEDGAFRISSVDGARSWKLQKIDGVAVFPERTTVDAGQALEFTLTFETIPDDLRHFNVGEGTYDPDSGETSWQFFDVRLRSEYKN